MNPNPLTTRQIITSLGAALVASLTVVMIFTAVTHKSPFALNLQQVQDLDQTAAVADFNSNLVAHYAFDEASGTVAADSSGNGNAGTLTNGPSWTTSAKVGSGALSFDGTDDLVSVPDNAVLDGFTQFSVSLWGKQNAAVSGGGLVRKYVDQSGQRSFDIYTTLTNEIAIEVSSNGSTRETDTSSTDCGFTSNDVWTLVTVTFNAGAIKYYKNGVLCGTDSSAITTVFNSPVSMVIGANNDGAKFNGTLDDVRIYNRALEQSEIAELYALGGETAVVGGGGGDGGEVVVEPPVVPEDPAPPTTTTGITPTAGAITYYVSPNGNDANPGTSAAPLKTIQKCANVARAGNTCLVSAGNYPEKVKAVVSGTSGQKIVFRSAGSATVNEFEVEGNYVRIEGFDFTGAVRSYGFMLVTRGIGNEIIGNTVHDPVTSDADAIAVSGSGGRVANNTVYNWPIGAAIGVYGDGHVIENNIVRDSSDIDAFRVFGRDHIIRKNTVRNITDGPRGNHIDFIQTFGQNGTESYNILVEQNFVENLQGGLSQFEQGCGKDPSGGNNLGNNCGSMPGVNGTVTSVTANSLTNSQVNWITGTWTADHWKGAVVSMVSGAAFGNIYLISSSNSNTLTVTRMDGSVANLVSDGVKVGDMFQIRMRVGWWTFKNNVFKDISNAASVSMPYVKFINNTSVRTQGTGLGGSLDRGWAFHMELVNNVNIGYAPTDFIVPTFYADYNYAGTDATWTERQHHRCTEPWLVGEYSQFFFCEEYFGKHGINGGDPMFKNYNNAIGPDGIAWTADDGLQPLSGSPLCGAGRGGVDMGAYPCSGSVQSGDVIPPSVPTGLASSNITPTSVTLSWNASTDASGIANYRVYRGGVSLATVTGTTYTDSSLVSGTTYSYAVAAVDASANANLSAKSAPLAVTAGGGVVSSDCALATVRCVDDTSGSTQEYATIQACANVANAGDVCLVHPGNYSEFVQVDRGGTSSGQLTFRATGKAVTEGFRVKKPYVTIDGFDITKYGAGLSPAHITVEAAGSNCIISNNTIHDGIQLSSNDFYLNGTTRTITTAKGGFLAAGFEPGMSIYLATNPDFVSTGLNLNHNTAKGIKAVTDTTITLSDTSTLLTEGPRFYLLYATRSDKSGINGIEFPIISGQSAGNCKITGNTLRNLAGTAMNLRGNNHLIERNSISDMHGWWIFKFEGSNNTFRYNHVRNSPRYPGFSPTLKIDHSTGTGSWDFFAAIFRSMAGYSNNVFEYNFFENLDNEFATVSTSASDSSSRGIVFRYNVFTGIEAAGAFHRPEIVFENNTFYRSGHTVSGRTFIVSSTEEGTSDGSIIKNNAFVDNNGADTDLKTAGWYGIVNVNQYTADYNFVAGPAALGFPGKTTFNESHTVSNGLNGGDPKFRNINNIAGPDGIPFTLDDGLKPLPGSPLCGKGENGKDIGAYSCAANLVFADSSVVVGPDPSTSPVATTTVTDTTSPSLSSIRASAITTSSAVITWTTNEPATTQVQYGLTTAYGSQTTLIPAPVSSHTVTLSSLTPNTLYHYRVISKDAAGNTATSGDGTFSTLSLNPVTQAPVVNTPPANVEARTVTPPVVATVPVTTPASFTFTRHLTVGSTGSDVKVLQQYLNANGYQVALTGAGSPGRETTYYGPATTRAIQKFQCAVLRICTGSPTTNGYGNFGPATRAALNARLRAGGSSITPSVNSLPLATGTTTPYTFTRNLKVGMTGADVKALQQYLNAKGFQVSLTGAGSPGKETSYYGPATARAVTRFQEAYRAEILTPNNLTRGTGYFGISTRNKVNTMR